ncbi:MAG TPA: HEAT repeat domain-containing protein [Steroidobacteraceae bacterium]|nr:HEAT repeat domain-containing protein [Steroidobacteraceae bacterium]
MRFKLTTLALAIATICGAAYAQAEVKSVKSKVIMVADRAPTGDEELALAALEGLLAQPGERALPILKKVLAGSQSTLVKQRALFVLSQIDTAEARQMLAQASRSTNEDLRREAIRSIGISGDPKALDSLQELYNAGNEDAKDEVLQAWLISGRKDLVYQAALGAKTEDEATSAIRMLGAMGATDELRKLGDRPNASSGLVEAFAISGDLASLRKIAEGNGNRDTRLDAVRKIGIVDSDGARTALREIYAKTSDAEIKEAALQGMLIAGDDKGVLELYRAAKSSDDKRALLRYLSMMDSDVALEAIDQALGEKK